MTCLDDAHEMRPDPVGEFVELMVKRHRLSVVDADAVEQVARTALRMGSSKACAIAAARRAAVHLSRPLL